MQSEPFHADVATDAAVIHPVTPEILDEAAHKAAQLADDVAHHAGHDAAPVAAETVPAGDAQPREPDGQDAGAEAASLQHDIAETGQTLTSEAADGVAETTREGLAGAQEVATQALAATGSAVERSGAVMAEAAEAANDAAVKVADTGHRLASDAEKRLSDAGDAVGRLNAAVFGMIRTNMAATGEFFAALVKAQSVPEAVAINADHLRRQFDTLTTQGRELAQLTQALALDALKLPAGSPRRDA